MNKKIIYGVLALFPLVIGLLFVVLSETKMYEKLPFQGNLTNITKKTHESLAKNFPFRLGLDLSSGVRLVYKADVSKLAEADRAEGLNILRDVIERRVNAFGVSEPLVQIESSLSGEDRLLVELPGLTNVEQAIKLIGETPTLEFKLERATGTEQDAILAAINNYRQAIASGTTPTITPLLLQDPYYVSIGLDGRYLKRSQLQFDQTSGSPIVSLEWDETGKAIFASTTAANIGKNIGIYLDGQLISAPTVQSAITDGKAIISGGNTTREEAKLLAQRLNTGALPVPVEIIGSELVEPTLGGAALAAGILATVFGLLFIAFMMVVWYRLPGLVGVISLLSYIAVVLSIFKLIPVTLSAAAIAGFIISIGLAVDGNILTFERLKEELNKGKKLGEALDEAFGRSWTSIRDSNIASLIVAVILFFIGTSVIKGFALTLIIGVLVSMFTNVVLTRTMLKALVRGGESRFTKFMFKSPF
jgi:preprotein translocase subunit SecD